MMNRIIFSKLFDFYKYRRSSRFAIIFILLTTLLFSSSCFRNQINTDPEITDFNNLIIPDDFDFKSTRDIYIDVIVSDEVQSLIEIYNQDPEDGGELIKKGICNSQYSFSADLVLPLHLTKVFVQRKTILGKIESKEIDIASDVVTTYFGNNNKSLLTNNYLVEAGTYPECGTDCDYNVSAADNEIDPSANETWCVPSGTTFEGDLDFPSWGENYLIICGNATIEDYSNGKGIIVVSSTGSLTFEESYNPAWGSSLINYGTVTFKKNSTWKSLDISGGIFENHGTFSANDLLLDNSDFLNLGTITLYDDMELNTCSGTNDGTIESEKKLKIKSGNDEFENFGNLTFGKDSYFYGSVNNYDGSMTFEKDLVIKGGSDFTNSCELFVGEQFKIIGDYEHIGYLECELDVYVDGGTEILMAEGSLISTEDLKLYGDIEGSMSGYCKIEVLDDTYLYWGSNITGKVDLCDAGNIESNNANIGTDVTYCTNEVPNTACVPGAGVVVADADNDGITDSLDEFPNDPNKAFSSFYPNSVDFASIAFEDLWPAKGDYDFNDLVIDFQYQIISNASNQISEIVALFKIEAVGATLSNGFGVSFDMPSSAVSSVTGYVTEGSLISYASSGVENGHTDKTVVIVYDNINDYINGSMMNTNSSNSYIAMSVDTIVITLSTPQSSIGTEPFNPFVFVDQDRGREIHLVDMEPTALVNQQYFGQNDDNSGSGNYYKTINNYPWAIEVPEEFEYPQEKADIVSSHLKFGVWAESSGSSYTNWYQNQPGYRNILNIYDH